MSIDISTHVVAKLKDPVSWKVRQVVDGIYEIEISIDNGHEIIKIGLMQIHLAEMQAELDEAMDP